MDDATSPRIRRAHPARGNNRPRQRVGHQGRAHTDRGRMVRALGPPHGRSPRQETKRSGGGTHRRPLRGGGGVASTTNASTHPTALPSGSTGPPRGSTTTTPPTPRVVDTTGRRILYVGEDLATSACEVFGDAGIAAICPTTGSPSSPQRHHWLCATWQQKARPWRSAHCRPSATPTRPAP